VDQIYDVRARCPARPLEGRDPLGLLIDLGNEPAKILVNPAPRTGMELDIE
jgi:hypothetical protein